MLKGMVPENLSGMEHTGRRTAEPSISGNKDTDRNCSPKKILSDTMSHTR